ncbi:tRNA (adenosine(37)-N6)-threonylcarbamoyltransferase complex transferase subunit TsaD, partial [Bosea sp. (in: a-proteobacteria)]|uniref:tRNA (adenosine(37)-N6)-threonylcarbamoyltransferase complex transferase subunit TsaD n=1 Tax=Bosea sp. (in: a-proteobacteria) TaxID=1871050 RepID=UPI0027330F7E
MRVLGIETTCDETAAAIVSVERSGEVRILSNEVLSQIAAHAAYGGVVPEIAARAHVEAIDRIVSRAFETAGLEPGEIDAVAAAAGPGLVGGVMVGLTTAKAIALVTGKPFIAVTSGPGLIGGLMVGLMTAKAIAMAMALPFLGVNHLEGHALTARLTDNLAFPYLLLLVSGGHTQLLAVRGVGDYLKLGGTIDDAVGEAFDKIAKMLGLPYPGGPSVEREAAKGDPERFDFPRPMQGRPNPDFSLSGLKTAVRLVAERIAPLSDRDVADLCASFHI